MGNTVNVKPPGNSMIEQINTYLPKSLYESPENMNKRLFLEIQKTKNTDDHIMFLLSKIDINTCNEDGENLLHIFTKYYRAKRIQVRGQNASAILTSEVTEGDRRSLEGTKYTYVYDYYLQHLFDIGCDINKRENLFGVGVTAGLLPRDCFGETGFCLCNGLSGSFS